MCYYIIVIMIVDCKNNILNRWIYVLTRVKKHKKDIGFKSDNRTILTSQVR